MFDPPKTLRQIAEIIGASLDGDDSLTVESIASLDEAAAGQLTFASNEKHAARLSECQAVAAIVYADAPPVGQLPLLRVADVAAALRKLLADLAGPEDLPDVGVHPSAVIADSAVIAADAAVGANVTIGLQAKVGAGSAICAGANIGADVVIGDGCMLAEGVVVRYRCVIGNRVRIGSNSVIGYDGYGYDFAGGVHHKVPHAGNVVVEDDVEFGACTCVDRAKWGSTRIGAGSKIDNLVQIAHNVQVSPGCILAAQAGVAGSTKLGRFVVLGGQVGVRDNIEIGDGTEVGACCCVAQTVKPGQTLLGIPAIDARTYLREVKARGKLPELLKRVKTLEHRIEQIEAAKKDS
jgi:UDP-3-O-[3-hydroxymyristoyl] glucosamine N-acyltransferase